MVEREDRAENWRSGLWWIVNVAAMEWSYGDRLPWWCWEWGMGNDEEKGLKDGIGWSEERYWEKWRRNLALEEENTTFKEEVRISHNPLCCAKISHSCGIPRQRAWFWKFVPKTNSHKVRTRFAFLWNSHWDFGKGPRACIFWKLA